MLPINGHVSISKLHNHLVMGLVVVVVDLPAETVEVEVVGIETLEVLLQVAKEIEAEMPILVVNTVLLVVVGMVLLVQT